jgi:glycosyltransferase involved in cell wall biosynthesis
VTEPSAPVPELEWERHGSDRPPSLSLVMCTRNRARFLEKTLDSLTRLASERDWGMVLVDNGSSDDTQEVL